MTALTKLLSQQLKDNPSRRIIKDIEMKRWFTGEDLSEDVHVLQNLFKKTNLRKGDQILVCLPNSAVFPVINQAAWNLGIIVHPISPSTPIAELQSDWNERHYAAILITDEIEKQWRVGNFNHQSLSLLTFENLKVMINQQRELGETIEVEEDDLGLILNTSGTTGKPKRVGLTHKMLLNAAKYDAESNLMTRDDVTLVTMPMFHINAQVMITLSSRVANSRMVVAPKFSASRFWQQVYENEVTWVSVVPTIISLLLLNEQSLKSYSELQNKINLRYVLSSSFALPEEQLRKFQNQFDTLVIEGYGMTEATSQCTINPFDAPKIGSAGKPYGTEVQIIDSKGQFTSVANTVGEIVIKGNHVITEYLDPNPDSFRNGWFLTGDLGYFDRDGYLFVKGRKKEIISHGGEKVAPAAVENVLHDLDFVAQLAVIGMPDDLYGEEVTVVVVSKTPGHNEAEQRQTILEFSRQHLAKYEAPTRVEFLEQFPRNSTGKVLRPQLQKLLEG